MKLFVLALLLVQSKGEDVDCENVLFADAGPVTAVRDQLITKINIQDKMVYEMDVDVSGIPTEWASVFHCGAENLDRQPGIWLYPTSDDAGATHEGFHFSFSINSNRNPWVNPGPIVNAGESFHLLMTYTQSSLTIFVNDVKQYENLQYDGHPNKVDQPCYIGDPWYPAAEVVLSNIKISSMEACDCRSSTYSQDKEIAPATANNEITRINIEDNMRFSMDVKVNSIPTNEWSSVFHCGVDNGHRTPGIWLYPTSDQEGATHEGFHFVFSHNADNPWRNPGPLVEAGHSYHIEQIITQSTYTIKVNDVIEYHDNAYGSHVNPQNIPCYAGDPWYPAADIDITNLQIESGAHNCNCPHMFEYDHAANKCVRDCSLFAFEDYRDTCSSYAQDLAAIRSSISTVENTLTPRIDEIEAEVDALAGVTDGHARRIEALEATVNGLGEAAYAQPLAYDYPPQPASFFQENKDLLLILSLLMNGAIMVSVLVLCGKLNSREIKYAKISSYANDLSEQEQLKI
jgi:hypothetical protein